MQTFGERLKRIRTAKGWTQQDLAMESGVPYETIYRVERGTHQEPRVSVAAKLARTLGVSLDVLAGVYEEAEHAGKNARQEADATLPPQPKRQQTRTAASVG
jgi:transcriptional regulator with XRE-family HTH domain